jgi:DNA-binding helix-hairpin-helix protein with protein kinase domain
LPTQYVDQDGNGVQIGRQVGRRGGEGSVFEALSHPGFAVKLYHEKVTDDKAAKVHHLAQLARANPNLLKFAAWPTALVWKGGSEPSGFLMPLVRGKEIHQLFGPSQRLVEFPSANWDFLVHVARNCAAVFDSVHSLGAVIGDVNEGNILVGGDGTVRLIDCDSYQVANNGQIWTCDVGIPLWTPPELQGVNFRGLRRLPNHDLFGLAVMIFKLLFMGRHPYAGIPTQAGDFVLEKAIAQYMFAFSPRSPSLGMRPPPHCLSLNVFPRHYLEYFESAFMRGGELRRPAAAKWVQALDFLAQNLSQCGRDPSHKHPRSASQCPWCAITIGGGPNFFVSITVAVTGASADPMALWSAVARIEMASLRVRARNEIPIPGVSGTGLPSGLQRRRPQFIIGAVMLVFGVLMLVSGQTVLAFGMILVGIGLISGGSESADYAAERMRRQQAEAQARGEFESLYDELSVIPKKYESEFRKRFAALESAYRRFLDLDRERAAEMQKLQHKRRDLQLQAHLGRQIIARALIPDIGPTRSSTLLAYGVETALDIKPSISVPGIGPTFLSRLMDWRYECERTFEFRARDPIPPQEIHQLNVKMTTLSNNLISDLKQGPQSLSTLGALAKGRIAQLDAQIDAAAERLGHARADLIW